MAAPARANVIYTLDIDHFGGAGGSPYGTITLVQAGANQVDMTIALNNGNRFVLTGQQGSTVAFNSIENQAISIVSSSLPGWSVDPLPVPGAFGADGFGTFQYSLNCCNNTLGGGAAQAGPITLRLSGAGLTEASFAELSLGGSPSAFFAVDIIGSAANGGFTGFVGTSTPGQTTTNNTTVPEPSALMLLGLGLGTVARQIRKRRAA